MPKSSKGDGKNIKEVNVFSSTSGLNITLEIISHKAKEGLNADWITCFAPNSSSGRMRVLVNLGLNNEQFSHFQSECSKFTLRDFIGPEKISQTLIINGKSEEIYGIAELIFGYTDAETITISPSIMYGQLLGYMVCGYNRKKSVPKDINQKAEPFADQMALALKYNQLDKITRRQNARLAALLDLSTTIYSSLNYEDVLEKVAVYSKDLVGADSCSIYIRRKFTGELEPIVVKDFLYSEQLKKHIIKPGEGVTGKAVLEKEGKIANEDEKEAEYFRFLEIKANLSSVIAVPLIWSEEVLGAISLRKWERGRFSKGDLDILTIFARQAADAIENARLFESLENAYNELSTAQEQLIMSEKLRALGEMAAGIAHDFNNLLGVILGNSQLLQRLTDNSKQLGGLRAIEEAALNGAETVRRIQEFTCVASPGKMEEIDPNELIKEAIEVTKPKWKDDAQRKGIFIKIETELNAKKPIFGNLSDLKEAIGNLIRNSVDALPNGGNIIVRSREENDTLYIEVEDNGIGMNEETAKKVFFPFFTTKHKQGTGLGLAVTYGIVSRHKGEITVKSSLGKGTIFRIKLPLKTENVSPAVLEDLTEVRGRKAHILIIDDDENIRNILEEMLNYSGHTVVVAHGGRDGIEKFEPGRFDMVFTDLGMPEISGWDVAREIKNKDKSIPLVLISGWGAQLDEETLQDSGVDLVVAKPFKLEKLIDVVSRAFLIKEGKLKYNSPLSL